MFGTFLIYTVSVAHLYVFWRAGSVPFFRHHVPKKLLVSTGLILWLLFIAGILYGRNHGTVLASVLQWVAMTWLGILFLFTSAMLAIEVVTGFGFLLPCLAAPLRGFALFVGFILSVVALVQGYRAPVIDAYQITMPGLPAGLDGTVVVALSDLHLGHQLREDWLADRLAQVRALHPDLVVLLGDVFEGHEMPRPGLLEPFRGLRPPLGVWGVLGNHEFYSGTQTFKAMQGAGIRLLRNSWSQVRPGLILAGVEQRTTSRRPGDKAGLITATLTNHPPGAIVLLAHKPLHVKEAAAAGVDLMLAGHTHGGQIWPFNYLMQYFFPYLSGRYRVNGMTLLVSRGAGTWGPRMRLWLPGEILKITLRTGSLKSTPPIATEAAGGSGT